VKISRQVHLFIDFVVLYQLHPPSRESIDCVKILDDSQLLKSYWNASFQVVRLIIQAIPI